MVIPSSLASTNLENSRTPVATPAGQSSGSAPTTTTAAPVTPPDELNSISDDLDLPATDAVQQSVASANYSILTQSSMALCAQANHSPQTVFSLLQD